MSQHIFSYYSSKIEIDNNNSLKITDFQILHRLLHVGRVKNNTKLILFDNQKIYNLNVDKIEKNKIFCNIENIENIIYADKSVFYIPLLEKDYLEEALYSCAIAKISQIYIVDYEYSKKNWGSKEKDWQRAQAILIGACEQSKQYQIPKLHTNVISFDNMITQAKNLICAHIDGINIREHLQKNTHEKNLSFTCGPEAGFSLQEEDFLKKHAKKINLTNSILRSRDAVYYLNAFFSIN